MIYEIENFLDDDTCDKIIYNFKASKIRSMWQSNNYFNGRTLNPSEIQDSFLNKKFLIARDKATQLISKLYSQFVYLEFWDIVYWYDGLNMLPHSDKENEDGSPHITPNRDFSSVIYLNDDYFGGRTFFNKQNIECIPQKGKILIFPSTLEFTHGVTTVIGDRYTVPMWFTKEEEHIFTFNKGI